MTHAEYAWLRQVAEASGMAELRPPLLTIPADVATAISVHDKQANETEIAHLYGQILLEKMTNHLGWGTVGD